MREIKFRAWHNNEIVEVGVGDDGHVTVWDDQTGSLCIGVSYDGASGLISRCETLMQYTGLKDKNGVEIYEGDIVICNGLYLTVSYDEECSGFRVDHPIDLTYVGDVRCIEVVGNIHENPEELEVR